MEKVYYLIVSKTHDREAIRYTTEPTEEEILKAIKEHGGTSARVEPRYELKK